MSIVLFGDSITQQGYDDETHWVASLSNMYIRRLQVINMGFSGYSTKLALSILPQIIKETINKDEVKLFTIFFGANDAVVDPSGSQHVSVSDYKVNLVKIVDMVKSNIPNSKILLISPPPTERVEERTFENTLKYKNACLEVAKDNNICVFDTWTAFNNVPLSEVLSDGLHFSKKGGELFFRSLKKVIAKEFPELCADNLAYKYPDWKEF
ncbi:hypothetical protein HDU92_005944 [Lobulomyces angularis]|nr:hypothetical protein HDU92_005944 [Lobulomyces angularis]